MKQRLGKGLGALIGEETTGSSETNSVLEVDVNNIDPNTNQPRQKFDEEKLQELAQSIKSYGIVQPIIVQENGDRYIIIAERTTLPRGQDRGAKDGTRGHKGVFKNKHLWRCRLSRTCNVRILTRLRKPRRCGC